MVLRTRVRAGLYMQFPVNIVRDVAVVSMGTVIDAMEKVGGVIHANPATGSVTASLEQPPRRLLQAVGDAEQSIAAELSEQVPGRLVTDQGVKVSRCKCVGKLCYAAT